MRRDQNVVCVCTLFLICVAAISPNAPAQRRALIQGNQPSQAGSAGTPTSSPPMQSPVLGFAYAASLGEVRAILGVPGASRLGDLLTFPGGVTAVYFAPGQKCAIVERSNGASIGLLTFPGATLGALIGIPGGVSRLDLVSFSPRGTAAVVYSSIEARLQVITGLPGAPQLAREVTIGDLPDRVRLLAIADDGVTLLEGTISGSVYVIPSGGPPQLLITTADLGALVFAPGSDDALVFDRSEGAAWLLQDISGTPSSRLLRKGLTGLGTNVLAQMDVTGAIITGTNTHQLWRIDLQSLEAQGMQLPIVPATLQPLRITGRYLLSWEPRQPAWILDTGGVTAGVYFVPAVTSRYMRSHGRPRRPSVPRSTGP